MEDVLRAEYGAAASLWRPDQGAKTLAPPRRSTEAGTTASGDRFRIKIWNKATGIVVYDNQLGAADDATASQVIAGGNIVIHTNGGVANR